VVPETPPPLRGLSPVAATTPDESAPTLSPAPPPTPTGPTIGGRAAQNPIFSWFMGSHMVVRVGIVVLFFGVAFLLRFAAEQGWLSIELRLTGAGLLGLALVYGGWYVREERRMYALTLQGGGIGIAYLTTFAAFRLYELLPAWLSLLVLVGLGVLCAGLAILNNVQSLAVLAIAGGFAAPILTSTGEGSHVILFAYFALLNVAILAIAWFKSWRGLNLVGFTFTFVLATLWGVDAYRPEHFATVEPFLILFFVFYVAIGLLYAIRQPANRLGVVDGTLVFGTPIVAFLWQTPLVADIENGLGWTALGMGVFYLLLAGALFLRGPAPFMLLREIYLALGMVFVMLAVPLTYATETTAAVWAIAGAGLVWSGLRQGRPFSTFLGGLVQLAAAGLILVYWVVAAIEWSPILGARMNSYAIGAGLVTLAALATAYLMLDAHRRGRVWLIRQDLQVLHIVTTLWGLGWWLLTGLHELVRLLPEGIGRLDVIVLFLIVTAILGELAGRALQWFWVRTWGFALWIPLTLAVIMRAGPDFPPLLSGVGWLVWPLAPLVHYWILRRIDVEWWSRPGHPIGLWLVTLVATVALATALPAFGLETWLAPTIIVVPALLIWLIATQRERPHWSLQPRAGLYFNVGLPPLVVLMFAWTLVVNFSHTGPSTPLPWWPVLNPLSLVQLLAFAAGIAWVGVAQRQYDAPGLLRGGRVAGLWLMLLWASAEIARVAHHFHGVPFDFVDLLDTPTLQTIYSIVWTLSAMAFMFIAIRRGLRWLWLTGASVLALTVLKLFTVDLAGAETLARIISFIVVGLLMLLIGYIAPIPPLPVTASPTESSDTAEEPPTPA